MDSVLLLHTNVGICDNDLFESFIELTHFIIKYIT